MCVCSSRVLSKPYCRTIGYEATSYPHFLAWHSPCEQYYPHRSCNSFKFCVQSFFSKTLQEDHFLRRTCFFLFMRRNTTKHQDHRTFLYGSFAGDVWLPPNCIQRHVFRFENPLLAIQFTPPGNPSTVNCCGINVLGSICSANTLRF